MKYMGSKARIAKYILPIILQERKTDQLYIEPFVGGCNSIDKVSGPRCGFDINPYIIKMWKALQNGWVPPDNISNDEYLEIKNNKNNFPPQLVGFVGIGCSYSGKWFGGYARGKNNKGQERNYCKESKNNVLKQVGNIKGVFFDTCSYNQVRPVKSSIIYCDIPYKNATQYKDRFDHEKFWEWCREMVSYGHRIFVSEYCAPNDFKCIWEKKQTSSLTKDTGSKIATERLFTIK